MEVYLESGVHGIRLERWNPCVNHSTDSSKFDSYVWIISGFWFVQHQGMEFFHAVSVEDLSSQLDSGREPDDPMEFVISFREYHVAV